MGKKKRIWAYSGSLIKPIGRYITKIDIVYNPRD
jgi:hypothetical protein